MSDLPGASTHVDLLGCPTVMATPSLQLAAIIERRGAPEGGLRTSHQRLKA